MEAIAAMSASDDLDIIGIPFDLKRISSLR